MSAQFDEIINFRFDDSEFVIKVGDLMSKVMVVFVTHEVRLTGPWVGRRSGLDDGRVG